MAKNVLKANMNTTAVMPYFGSRTGAPNSFSLAVDVIPLMIAMLAIIPDAPKSMSLRRPARSINGMATRPARKYSVPLQADKRRDISGPKPSEFSKT
jgi:hypothetical protein